MEKIIGMSTGVLHKVMHSLSLEAIAMHKLLGSQAIEIGCIKKKSLEELVNLDAQGIRAHFQNLSLHAPTDLVYGDNAESESILEQIAVAHAHFHFDCVVIHPENVKDWSVLSDSSFPIGIENADYRKDFGRTVADIDKVLSGTNFGFVLDVNHCFSNDESMVLAQKMLERFADRLCEIHLSGFAGFHELIYVTQQTEIMDSIAEICVPIIIESVCRDREDFWREYSYVKKYL